jgi:putative hydrolases of HD superfamily
MHLQDPVRLTQQIQFIVEIDQLKQVLRQTPLIDGSRRENSAEHSWHLATMALVLQEYAPPEVELLHVMKMLVLHDIVEIRAGDTFCYDVQGNLDKALREQEAAGYLFGLLPSNLCVELRDLWEEFEAGATPSARFANALDRLQPLLHNYRTQGVTWRSHCITRDQVLRRMSPIQEGAPELWSYVLQVIDESCAKGYLP